VVDAEINFPGVAATRDRRTGVGADTHGLVLAADFGRRPARNIDSK